MKAVKYKPFLYCEKCDHYERHREMKPKYTKEKSGNSYTHSKVIIYRCKACGTDRIWGLESIDKKEYEENAK